MLVKHGVNPKLWLKFAKTIGAGKILNFRCEQLSKDRYEDFIDFKMKYFVKHEITHVIAGIPKNPEAMQEYREIITNAYKDPIYHTFICCVDDEKSEIVAFDSLKLFRKGDVYVDVKEAQTAEVKKFYKILHQWNKLCPVPDILTKYGVDKYFDDAGCAVHSDYRGYKITNEVASVMQSVCKENSVPLVGAWVTSVATQKTTALAGWETVYEISYKELEKKLGVTFHNPPPSFKYNVKKI